MKAIIEEYGRIIILCLIALSLLSFALSADGLRAYIGKNFKPQVSVEAENNKDLIKAIAANKNYIENTFEVQPVKLNLEEEYNLLDYVTYSTNLYGDPLSVSVIAVTDEFNKSVSLREEDGKYIVSFSNDNKKRADYYKPGIYFVEFQAYDESHDLKLSFTYKFIVDTAEATILDVMLYNEDGSDYIEYPYRIYSAEEMPDFPNAPAGYEWHYVEFKNDGTYVVESACDLSKISFVRQTLDIIAIKQ